MHVAAFRQVWVTIADLPETQLGLATADSITLDVDAASYGWYTAAALQTAEDGAARMDLLTAVLHELGHVAGLEDQSDGPSGEDLMSGRLGLQHSVLADRKSSHAERPCSAKTE